MTIPTVPFKTPLGNEELRSRFHKLGQRHRTILLLIDGRRPLAEVLSLAHQAGSTTSHFEDLLRMEMVELPPEPAPPPPAREIPTLTDEARLTAVDMVVLEAVVEQSDLAPVLAPVPKPAPLRLTDVVAPVDAELGEPTVSPRGAPVLAPTLAATAVPPADPASQAPAAVATIASFGVSVRSGKVEPGARVSPDSTVHANEVSSSLAQLRPQASAEGLHRPPSTLDLQESPEETFERTMRQFPHDAPKELPQELPKVPPEEPLEAPVERTQQFPHQAPVELPSPAEPAPRAEPFKTRPPQDPGRTVPVLSEFVWASPDIAAPAASSHEPIHESVGPPPPPEHDEAELLQQIRNLLTDALRLDAPLFSARTFIRVRSAQSTGDLINLVWEIEDHLSHKRRSRRELQSLQHARELLGLGNTLVGGDDSRPNDLHKE